MDMLSQYGLFLLQTLTITAAVGFVALLILRAASGPADRDRGRLRVKRLDHELRDLGDAVRAAALPRKAVKALVKERKRERKQDAAAGGEPEAAPPRVYVLRFDGDLRATGLEGLRHEITAVTQAAQDGDEVLVVLTSGGGAVHAYGLAAAQLERLTDHGLRLTVAVDKVAASGGYMMACVADHLIAARFAILGSIGVVAAVPNVRRLLERHDIDVEHMTAGEFKRTLSFVGVNDDKGRAKFQEQLDETHDLFKAFVARHRPALDMDTVATGEIWYGEQALDLGLIDQLATSDAWLAERASSAQLFEVQWQMRKPLAARLAGQAASAVESVVERVWQRTLDERYP